MLKRGLVLVIALIWAGKVAALTLSDAETEVRRLIRDTATSVSLQRYPNATIDSFLNQAQKEVVTATWCLQASTSVVLSAATTYYSLPSDVIAVKLVRFKDSTSRTRNLTETSYKALYENNPDYERQTGPPMQYILRYSTSAGTSLQIAFLPIATTSSTGTATVDYYDQATDLSSAGDVLLNGFSTLIPYHESVVYQAVSKIKMIEGDTASAGAYLQLYQASIQAMNSRLGERPNLNPGASAGGVNR